IHRETQSNTETQTDRNTTVCIICHTGKYCSHPSLEIPLILINQKKTWREALSYCRVNHVDLVSVHTEEIQHWVETAVYYASTANVWMGLRHTCTLSFWFWVNGVSICYQNWAPGNGTGVEDCSGGERTGVVQSGSKFSVMCC
uniref:C-type lectin domain-containing protein n=1 Tax=Pygocentrus nattereri TaxID=42514 RepID=A0A3B4D2A7_PYGNA